MTVPNFDDLFNPLLKALKELGGSASVSEMEEKVAEILNLSESDINEIHNGNRTKFSYRLAWARTYLKNYGLLENSARGVWSLTLNGRQTEKIDKDKVKFNVRNPIYQTNSLEVEEEKLQEKSSSLWQEILLEELMKLSPSSFETLCQRILRESGFVQVKVTGKSGDGGIDGKGVVKLGSLLSFHVIFQVITNVFA